MKDEQSLLIDRDLSWPEYSVLEIFNTPARIYGKSVESLRILLLCELIVGYVEMRFDLY
jgi:hypothetical protein